MSNYETGDTIWLGDKEWKIAFRENGYMELDEVEVKEEETTDLEDLFGILPEKLADYFFDHGKEIDLGDLEGGWVGFVIEKGEDSIIFVDSVTGDALLKKDSDKEEW